MNTDLDKSEGQALLFNASRRVAGGTLSEMHMLSLLR